jgi:hypothetical protein
MSPTPYLNVEPVAYGSTGLARAPEGAAGRASERASIIAANTVRRGPHFPLVTPFHIRDIREASCLP